MRILALYLRNLNAGSQFKPVVLFSKPALNSISTCQVIDVSVQCGFAMMGFTWSAMMPTLVIPEQSLLLSRFIFFFSQWFWCIDWWRVWVMGNISNLKLNITITNELSVNHYVSNTEVCVVVVKKHHTLKSFYTHQKISTISTVPNNNVKSSISDQMRKMVMVLTSFVLWDISVATD